MNDRLSSLHLVEEREKVLVVEVRATLHPLLVLDTRDFIEVNTTLLDSSTKTEGIVLINVLILNGNPGLKVSTNGLEEGSVVRTDDLIIRGAEEVVFTNIKEVLLQHLLISKSGSNTFFVVKDWQEEVILEVLLAIRGTPEASSAEAVLHDLSVHDISHSIASEVLGEPSTAIAKVTILNTSHRDVLCDVVLVLHEHSTGDDATLRMADKDEAILEELLVLSDDLVKKVGGIINKSLKLLQASPFVVNVEGKEGVAGLELVELLFHLVELKIGASEAMKTDNRLECTSKSGKNHDKRSKNDLVHLSTKSRK